MDKRAALCELDRSMMRQFSDRSVQAIGKHRSIRVVMPVFRKLMSANLEKELDKDRIVIEAGSEASEAGRAFADIDTAALFERTKLIDGRFVDRLSGLPISLRLDYGRIGPVRLRRIEHLLRFVHDLCEHWPPSGGLAEAARACYEPAEVLRAVSDTLSLYADETRIICDSARLRGPARLAGRLITERVVKAMEFVKHDVVNDVGARFFHVERGP